MNPKAGCAGSVLNLLQMQQFNHQVEIEKGVLGEECSAMLSAFLENFARKRSLSRYRLDNTGRNRLYLNLRAAGVAAVP